MKKLTSLVLAALLVALMAMPLTGSAMTWDAYIKTGNGEPVRLRTGPTTDSSVQTSMPYGAKVVILGEYDDGTWITVAYKGYDGYCMKRYLTYDKPGPKPTPKPKPGPKPTSKPPSGSENLSTLFNGFAQTSYTAEVRPSTPGGIVHLRWAPSTKAGIILDSHQNDQLEVIAQDKTWAQVREPSSGVVGFMMLSFLTQVGVGSGSGSGTGGDS